MIRLGERVVRRRRVTYAAGVAALAAVAVVAGLTLGDSDPRRAVTPPAVSTRALPGESASATLTLDEDRYRVNLAADRQLTFERFDTTAGWVMTTIETPARPTAPTWVTSQEIVGTVIVVVPATVVPESPIIPAGFGKGWETSAYEELGGTGYRAQVYRLTGQNAPLRARDELT